MRDKWYGVKPTECYYCQRSQSYICDFKRAPQLEAAELSELNRGLAERGIDPSWAMSEFLYQFQKRGI